eukprot:g6278.t1
MSGEEFPAFDVKARRVKQLLASYYGTDQHHDNEVTSQPSTGYGPDDVSSVASATGTPKFTTIDSPAFNAESYVSTMIRTARVDTLMKKHAEMVREIHSLDGDMQMLVYENYNKFISATDTIRSMKSNVDGMGTKMKELKTIMDGVATTSENVNSKLQKHRDGIEELSGVKILLQKLQSVIDLPKKMAIAVKEEAYSVAVNNYCEARALLEKYGHQGAFRSVSSDCETFIEQATKTLKNRLMDPEQDAVECASLLRKLKIPELELQELFLNGRQSNIKKLLNEATKVVHEMIRSYLEPEVTSEMEKMKWIDVNTGTVTVSSFVKKLDRSILASLSQIASDFNSTFSLVLNTEALTPLDRTQLTSMARTILMEYQTCLIKALALAGVIGAFNALHMDQAGVSKMDLVSEQGQEMLMIKVDDDWGAKQLSQSLLLVATDLHLLESRLPETEPNEIANLISKSSIEYHLCMSFRSLLHRVIGTLIAIKQAAKDSQVSSGSILAEFRFTDLQRFYTHLCDLLLNGLSNILHDFHNYETSPPLLASWNGSFIDLLQNQIQELFLTLISGFKTLVNQDNNSTHLLFQEVLQGVHQLPLPESIDHQKLADFASSPIQWHQEELQRCPAGLILLCARLCSFLETSLVPHAVELLASTFPGAGVCDRPAFNPSEVIRRLNSSSMELLRVYIESYGNSLSTMIRQSIAAGNWLNHKEPRAPRSICDLLLSQLENAEREIVQLVDDGGNRSRRNLQSPLHRKNSSSTSADLMDGNEGTGALERNVAKLFRQRVQLGLKAEFSHSSIQAAILGAGLKSWIECVRQKTLSRTGLQQLQIDVVYLRPLVARFVRGKESDTVNALMEEVVAAAIERSLDPTLLEASVVDKILTSTDDTEL